MGDHRLCAIALIFFSLTSVLLFFRLKKTRHRNKKLQEINIAKDKFFTVVGHDLSAAINQLYPVLELFKTDQLNSEAKEFLLNSFEERILYASDTLQSLLNWGVAKFKGLTLNPVHFDLSVTVNSYLRVIEFATNNKALTIKNDLPDERSVYFDIDHFRFIVRNLMINAIKYSRQGGYIQLNCSCLGSDFLIFSVKDSGTGITQDKIEQIFQPFVVSTEGTHKEKGNGIGLMLCRDYARANGGDLWVDSERNVGATFFLALKAYAHELPFKYTAYENGSIHFNK